MKLYKLDCCNCYIDRIQQLGLNIMLDLEVLVSFRSVTFIDKVSV